MEVTKQLLEAALAGYSKQKAEVEARMDEVRHALSETPSTVTLRVTNDIAGLAEARKVAAAMLSRGQENMQVGTWARVLKPKKRAMSAAGRARIAAATKARWAAWRKAKGKKAA